MSSSQLNEQNGETRCNPSQQKTQNQIKTKTTRQNGAVRCILIYRNGCKNSEKILWMIEFLKAETHTPVLLMNYLWSLRLREVRILGKHNVKTHFLKDRNCETEDQNHKGPVRKTHWRSRTSCRNFLVT